MQTLMQIKLEKLLGMGIIIQAPTRALATGEKEIIEEISRHDQTLKGVVKD